MSLLSLQQGPYSGHGRTYLLPGRAMRLARAIAGAKGGQQF